MTTRMICCGSRDFPQGAYGVIKQALEGVHAHNKDLIVIEGGASGADALSRKACEELGIDVIEIPANWKKYGKRAGPIRNKRMVSMCPSLVYAFVNKPLGQSRGTIDMCRKAKSEGIKVWILTLGAQGDCFVLSREELTDKPLTQHSEIG